ncbi:MAG: GIY-YIG nuclease family protein [Flavobacteriales bacterium]
MHSDTMDKFYVGSCSDLNYRLHKHNAGHAKFAAMGIPYIPKRSKEFETKAEALKFENSVKRMKSRKFIERLIEKSFKSKCTGQSNQSAKQSAR